MSMLVAWTIENCLSTDELKALNEYAWTIGNCLSIDKVTALNEYAWTIGNCLSTDEVMPMNGTAYILGTVSTSRQSENTMSCMLRKPGIMFINKVRLMNECVWLTRDPVHQDGRNACK